MASNVTFNGVTYSIPAEGDTGWGPDLTAYFISIASNAFQKTGGSFTLTAEANFGATYGLKTAYIKSQAANPSSAGIIRLGSTESISWRNNANNGNLALTTDASDNLLFNAKTVVFSGLIVNADISPSAAIAYSKLNLATSILNSDISASAAIAYSKLAALTASRVLVSDGSGVVSASSVTSTTLSYLDATSSIQTQIDSKQTRSVLTTKGDLYAATASDTVARLAAGANNTVLTADSAQSTGLKYSTIQSLTTAPTVQRFTSGSGTYTTPAGVKYIRVTMLGGGGGGGSDATAPANGSAGTSTTFGTSLLTAGAGQGGTAGGAGGNGGAPTINSPAITILSQSGAAGGPATGGAAVGGYGGVSFMGHAGPSGGGGASSGLAAGANSGSGGGGAGSASTASGGGGGAGAVIVCQINSPDSSYSYTIGTGGAGGSGTYSGGAGGSGVIVVEEFYQ